MNLWKSSAEKLHQTKYLALMAAMIALKTVLSMYYIPVSENLRVSISFLIVALEASIVGPAASIVSGAVTDLVSFVLFPDGAFFFGYTITAMLGELIYALFLYQKKITWQRLFLSKLLNNYLVNVLLGSLWSAILYSKGYYWYLARSAVKNTILLPFEVLALAALFKLLLPVLQKRGWIMKQS